MTKVLRGLKNEQFTNKSSNKQSTQNNSAWRRDVQASLGLLSVVLVCLASRPWQEGLMCDAQSKTTNNACWLVKAKIHLPENDEIVNKVHRSSDTCSFERGKCLGCWWNTWWQRKRERKTQCNDTWTLFIIIFIFRKIVDAKNLPSF